MKNPISQKIDKHIARNLWIRAQGLHMLDPFKEGPAKASASSASKVTKAIEHLGYVQIDTINVIERCHHHILYNRIPEYRPKDLVKAQKLDKTIFEYWTHALSYIPTKDFKFFVADMNRRKKFTSKWFQSVQPSDLKKVLSLIRNNGPISIRDIDDDVLVEKDHEWASKKPSKKALQLAFFQGQLVISERIGMLKQYELTKRHFEWQKFPSAASAAQTNRYLLDRALRSQSIVSLDSICHLEPSKKPELKKIIDLDVKKGILIPVHFEGFEKIQHWIRLEDFETSAASSTSKDAKQVNSRIGTNLNSELVHILSPFDPLIIQRKRLKMFFDYEHIFEAYVPKHKRRFGYFALPVLIGNEIVAAIDLKTDRENEKLLIQQWNWVGLGKQKHLAKNFKKQIETELHRFEKFQLGY